jgi:hypothetical protein
MSMQGKGTDAASNGRSRSSARRSFPPAVGKRENAEVAVEAA